MLVAHKQKMNFSLNQVLNAKFELFFSSPVIWWVIINFKGRLTPNKHICPVSDFPRHHKSSASELFCAEDPDGFPFSLRRVIVHFLKRSVIITPWG